MTRCGYVALLGAPNAGKSTLLNALVGARIAIVSPKVQTTRFRLTGVAMSGDSQLLFVDTPGIFANPKRRLERSMVQAAWSGAGDADVLVLLIDAKRGLDPESAAILEKLREGSRPLILALNKVDLVPQKDRLLGLIAEITAKADFAHVFLIQAASGDGVPDLAAAIAPLLPEGPWLYPEDQVGDLPWRLLAAEFTREQLFLQLHDELPYSLTVETESWTERPDGSVRIDQVIYIERDSQKPIVIGKGGARLKSVGAAARAVLTEQLERPVHLFLFVKVRENWLDDRERFREMGLDYDV